VGRGRSGRSMSERGREEGVSTTRTEQACIGVEWCAHTIDVAGSR